MATEARIRANQSNAQHSTGPKTESGKAASCKNNFKYGLTGASFTVLDSEDQDEYDHVVSGLLSEHQPSTMTESILVEKMAQSYWLRKRALYLQDECATDEDLTLGEQEKQLALFLRYQTTHDRAFHRALNDLLKLRAERRKARLDEAAVSQRAEDVKRLDEAAVSQRAEDVNTIGFESQRRREADQSRREAAEKRKQELHQFAVLLAEAKVDHQLLLNLNQEHANQRAAAA